VVTGKRLTVPTPVNDRTFDSASSG